MNIPDPQVECWDYIFRQSPTETVFVAVDNGNRDKVVTFSVNSMWKYLIVADTEADLLADVASFATSEDVSTITAERFTVGEIIQNWRLIRYNGRKVCVYGCQDYTPDSVVAYPSGPIAPVTNGWLYYLIDANGKAVSHEVAGFSLPIVSDHPNNLVEVIAKHETEDIELIADIDFHIICVHPLALADKHPVIWYANRAFPLLPVLNLNPNLLPDAEDQILRPNNS